MAALGGTARTVFVARDEEGPVEVIDEAGGRLRTLQFGSPARQSTMFTARPHELALEYTRSMAGALLFLPRSPQRTLMLGLGGGSLPKFLFHHYPDGRIDVVERRSVVVEVARRFFALPVASPRLAVHLCDGLDFLTTAPAGVYDLVLIDLHDAEGMAPVVDEEGFCAACRRVLRDDGGVAVYNLWFGERPAQEARLRGHLAQAFQPLLSAPVAGKRNHVAYGLRAPLAPASRLASRAGELGARLALPLPTLLADLRRRHPALFESSGPPTV